MSRTTDILLATGVCDYERIAEFNLAMEKNGFQPSPNTPHLGDMTPWVEKEVPGRKVYADGVWMACWNFGQPEILVKTFREFDWELPENAVLLYADEQSGTEVFRPEGYGCTCSGFPWDNGRHRKGSASPEKGWYCNHWKGEGR